MGSVVRLPTAPAARDRLSRRVWQDLSDPARWTAAPTPRVIRQPPQTWRATLVGLAWGLGLLLLLAICWSPVILIWRFIVRTSAHR